MASLNFFGNDGQAAEAVPLLPHELIVLKSVSPSEALRKLVLCQDGFEDTHIQDVLRQIAITLYSHQKLAPRYQSRMRKSRNTLLYFISAVSKQVPPEDIQEALAMKRLATTKMAGLYYWDCLYYAVVGDIFILRQDVGEHLEKHRDGAIELHLHGKDCESPGIPFTMLGLAEQLKEFWILLTDHRLLGPLECASRIKYMAVQNGINLDDLQSARTQTFISDWESFPVEEKKKYLDTTSGMYDAASMSSSEVLDLLWHTFAPKVAKARPDLDPQSWWESRGSFLSQRSPKKPSPDPNVFATSQEDFEFLVPSTSCTCPEDCECQVMCQYGANDCSCLRKRRNEEHEQNLRRQYEIQQLQQQGKGKEVARQDPNHLLGATTNEMAQMQIASMATGRPDFARAATALGTQHPSQAPIRPFQGRDRSHTLHQVPEGKPPIRKGVKDAYPTQFYADQYDRYPQFGPNMPPARPPPAVPSPPSPPTGPRPAPRQRYVLAGGDAPLSERKSIEFSMGEVTGDLVTPRASGEDSAVGSPLGGTVSGERPERPSGEAKRRKGSFKRFLSFGKDK